MAEENELVQMQVKPADAPPRFHMLAKPSGSTCNLDCTYCFFLSKEALYPNTESRMSDATLENYIRQLLEAHQTPTVTVSWQGGEPTLMGVDFFKRSVEYVEKHRRAGQEIEYTFQTNGVLLDDDFCSFLKEHDFLVGLSVDGPEDIHNAYRVDRGGKGTFKHVMHGWEHLCKHGVDYNILCTVHAANEHHGRRVYKFFRDDLGATWIQFIPIVERATAETLHIANQGWSAGPGGERLLYTQTGDQVTDRSVGGEQYGRFLVDIYEDWVRRDVGRVFVQLFDVTLHAYFGQRTLCIHAPTCGYGPALEHNGDVYTCDHYVEPDYKLGNINETHMLDLLASQQMRSFGDSKRDLLTQQCLDCEVLSLCNGGCPKDRFVLSRDGEPGHNYLCRGLFYFFDHVRPTMNLMARLVQRDMPAARVMEFVGEQDRRLGRNDPCPCGSGRKFKACHGRPA
ncbi:MAG: anaerobic sulfatase maturase [Anaerolineae bacterium]